MGHVLQEAETKYLDTDECTFRCDEAKKQTGNWTGFAGFLLASEIYSTLGEWRLNQRISKLTKARAYKCECVCPFGSSFLHIIHNLQPAQERSKN